MSEKQKKFFELQQQLKVSRKANQTAALAERKRKQAPIGSAEASEKRKWFEEKQRRQAKELGRLGLDEKDVGPPPPPHNTNLLLRSIVVLQFAR